MIIQRPLDAGGCSIGQLEPDAHGETGADCGDDWRRRRVLELVGDWTTLCPDTASMEKTPYEAPGRETQHPFHLGGPRRVEHNTRDYPHCH